MILIQLFGGLGNQMFQYAIGRHLSVIQKTNLYYFFDNPKGTLLRGIELNNFNIQANIANEFEVFIVRGFRSYLFDNYWVNNLLLGRRVIVEKKYNFNPAVLEMPDNSFLKGYWQSEKYFLPIRELLLNDFKLKNEISPEAKEIEKEIRNSNSVAVHLRRGDYLSPKNSEIYIALGAEYYENAARLILQGNPDCKFFIFSDDYNWAKENFELNAAFEVLKPNENPATDLYLMSQCKHQITANSSYSWWAAWLNTNPEKMVISPKKWFKTPVFETEDRIPESWIKM